MHPRKQPSASPPPPPASQGGPINPEDWMKLTKASQMLDVHIYTVQRWIRQRRIDGRKVSGRWYVRKDQIAALFRQPNLDGPPRMAVGTPKTSKWAEEVLIRAGIRGRPPQSPPANGQAEPGKEVAP